MRIEISDDIRKALEAWFKALIDEPSGLRLPSQEAAAGILELQKLVKSDPEGWTIRDYINCGRR